MSSSPKVAMITTVRNVGLLCHLILPHHLYFTFTAALAVAMLDRCI